MVPRRRAADPAGYFVWDGDVQLGTIGGAGSTSAARRAPHGRIRGSSSTCPARGGMFSLDNGREKRFLTRSRVLNPPEA